VKTMSTRPALMIFALLSACTPSQEPERVALEVVLDGTEITESTNDAGWTVTLTTARIAASSLQFTIQGEMHAATAWLPGWIVGRAWAHPGHYAGGDVTGELVGDFVFDWFAGDGLGLGTADVLVGNYEGLNFTFRSSSAADGLTADDPLLGHTAHFVGVARKGEVAVGFTAVFDVDAAAQMVGAPFETTVDAGVSAPIELRFLPTDPVEGKSLFDGVDFAALDALDMNTDGLATIAPGDVAHNIVRRALQSHVHYAATSK